MISKMKLQNGILTLIGFIMLVSICILVDRLESRKPEMEIRESVEGVNVYNEESKLKDLDQMDCVREKVYDAIKHIDYNKWLNVSFTGDKKWAI